MAALTSKSAASASSRSREAVEYMAQWSAYEAPGGHKLRGKPHLAASRPRAAS
jgi:hypothetical protein